MRAEPGPKSLGLEVLINNNLALPMFNTCLQEKDVLMQVFFYWLICKLFDVRVLSLEIPYIIGVMARKLPTGT